MQSNLWDTFFTGLFLGLLILLSPLLLFFAINFGPLLGWLLLIWCVAYCAYCASRKYGLGKRIARTPNSIIIPACFVVGGLIMGGLFLLARS